MLILNVADIHFCHPLCNTEMDPNLPYRTELVRDVRARVRELGPVDVILVGGDIAYHGWPQEYDAAIAWLTELAAVQRGSGAIYAFGEIRYRDAFDVQRRTRFRHMCWGEGVPAGHMSPCPDGNEAT